MTIPYEKPRIIRKGAGMTPTQMAVAQLKAYGSYIHDNAEAIIGSIDKPAYATEGGISLSFTLLEHDSVPTLMVNKEHIVLDAITSMPKETP